MSGETTLALVVGILSIAGILGTLIGRSRRWMDDPDPYRLSDREDEDDDWQEPYR